MTRRTVIALLALLSMNGARFNRSAFAAESLKDRFLREAPLGWARLRDAEQHVSGKVHVEYWVRVNASRSKEYTPQTNYDYNFKRSGDSIVLSHTAVDAPKQAVYGVNPEYQFVINRDVKDSSAPFTIFRMAVGVSKEGDDYIHNSTYFYRSIQSPREFWNVPLADIVSDPGFRLKNIAEATRDGRTVVRAEFDCESSKYELPDGKKQSWKNAYMILEPDNNWALLDAEYDMSSKTKSWHTTIKNEYKNNSSARLAIHALNRVEYWPDNDVESRSSFTFGELEDRDIRSSEFRLSAYGLPEPSQPTSTSRRHTAHFWFFGAAVGFLCLGLYLRGRAARAAGQEGT